MSELIIQDPLRATHRELGVHMLELQCVCVCGGG